TVRQGMSTACTYAAHAAALRTGPVLRHEDVATAFTYEFQASGVRIQVDGSPEHAGGVHVRAVVHGDAPAAIVGRIARIVAPDVFAVARVLRHEMVPTHQVRF